MDQSPLQREIEANYDAFQRMLGQIIASHRNQFALMRDRAVIDYFDKPGEAYRAGISRYSDECFSIQEVIDEPIDLGFYSHVAY